MSQIGPHVRHRANGDLACQYYTPLDLHPRVPTSCMPLILLVLLSLHRSMFACPWFALFSYLPNVPPVIDLFLSSSPHHSAILRLFVRGWSPSCWHAEHLVSRSQITSLFYPSRHSCKCYCRAVSSVSSRCCTKLLHGPSIPRMVHVSLPASPHGERVRTMLINMSPLVAYTDTVRISFIAT